MAKKKRKRSAKQKANDTRLSRGLKPKKQTKRKAPKRKAPKRKAPKRKAAKRVKKRVSRRKKSSDAWANW